MLALGTLRTEQTNILAYPNIQLTELYLCLLLVHRDVQLEEGFDVINNDRNLKIPLKMKKTCILDRHRLTNFKGGTSLFQLVGMLGVICLS